ncbi:MAG: ATP-binding protein [Acidobacteria bacterium]|nr:ATP-binding protein [Acidobacteriota bacterium]
MAPQDHTAAAGTGSSEHLLDSTLETIDTAEALVTEAAQRLGIDEDDIPGLGMAIRECVANAVVHGNRYSTKKKVYLKVWVGERSLEVLVGDEGDGFAVTDVPDPLAEENLMKQSGRGILLIRAFVDEFVVRKREPQGTEVRLVKHLPQ